MLFKVQKHFLQTILYNEEVSDFTFNTYNTLSITKINAKIFGESNCLGIFGLIVSEFLAHSKLDKSQTGVVIIAYLELLDCPTQLICTMLFICCVP